MPSRPAIRIRGARQNNLKGVDLDLPLGALKTGRGRLTVYRLDAQRRARSSSAVRGCSKGLLAA